MTDRTPRPYDEFSPADYNAAEDRFWMLPQGVSANTELSPGAKILYATLFSLAMKYGTAFAFKATLQKYLGNPSERTLHRWQNELIKAGFLRVLQKGRGMSNNYYFLRHPVLGNAEDGEFEAGPRYMHRDRKQGTQTVVTEKEARQIFNDECNVWYQNALAGKVESFPKPSWQYSRVEYSRYRAKWESRVAEETEAMPESVKAQWVVDTEKADEIAGGCSSSGDTQPYHTSQSTDNSGSHDMQTKAIISDVIENLPEEYQRLFTDR